MDWQFDVIIQRLYFLCTHTRILFLLQAVTHCASPALGWQCTTKRRNLHLKYFKCYLALGTKDENVYVWSVKLDLNMWFNWGKPFWKTRKQPGQGSSFLDQSSHPWRSGLCLVERTNPRVYTVHTVRTLYNWLRKASYVRDGWSARQRLCLYKGTNV